MSLFVYDTFADVAGTELTSHVGQLGATYTRHPATSTSTFNWWVSAEGRAYSTADTSSAPLAAHYLVSGVSDDDEYDVIAVWNLKSFLSDSYHGLTFRYDPATDTGYRLQYWSYSAFRKWVLQRIDAGVATDLGSYTVTPSVGSDTTIRIELRTTGIVVKFDGVTQITSTDTTIQSIGRVGLYAIGNPPASPTAGMHVSQLSVTSPGHVLPDYDLTGPATGMPLVAADEFTVSLADGVNPGSVTVTPALTGTLAGTLSPTSVVLADADRTKTFTFTPSGTSSGTIVVTDSAALADPPAVDFASGFFALELVDAWRAIVPDQHSTGSSPYVAGTGYALDFDDHYDPTLCMHNIQDDRVRADLPPLDWSEQIAAGITRYRDRFLIEDNPDGIGIFHPHHVNTGGLARHYYETGSPLDPQAVGLLLGPTGDGASYLSTFSGMQVGREVAFRGMACLDREWMGLGEHPTVDAAASASLLHIEQWVGIATGAYYGSWIKPFMAGLCMEFLIGYWERYRDTGATGTRAANVAAIPDAIKGLLDFLWDYCWYPPDDADLEWPHGAVVYALPATDDASMAPITGLTVGTVTSPYVFTLVGDLSATDDYYRWAGIVVDGITDDIFQVASYDGATQEVTLLNGTGTPLTPGTACLIQPNAAEADAGPGPSAVTNHMVSPAYAWAYWHSRVIESDLADAMRFRARHDALWTGGYQTRSGAMQQKQRNQSSRWGTKGWIWRDRGDDDEWPAATALTLQAPATGAAGLHSVESGPFRVSVPYGVSLDGPVEVTPASNSGLGTFAPATALLTSDRPYALFCFTPDVADDTSTVNISATATGLTAPSPVAYAVGTQAAVAYVYLINSPAGGILMLNAPTP